MTDDLLTVREVAEILRLHANTVRRMCDRGDLSHIRIVGRGDRRIRRSDLDEYLTARRFIGTHVALRGEIIRSHKEGDVLVLDEIRVESFDVVT